MPNIAELGNAFSRPALCCQSYKKWLSTIYIAMLYCLPSFVCGVNAISYMKGAIMSMICMGACSYLS